MTVEASSTLQREEASHLVMDSYLRLRALFYAPWVGGDLAALGNDVSSLVCIRDLVPVQLRACGRAVLALYENTPKWRCSCRVWSVSKWDRRKRRNEKLLIFPGYKWDVKRDKIALLSHTRQYHWSTQLLPPAPQPSTSHGSCPLTCFPWLAPMAGQVLFPPLTSFLMWLCFFMGIFPHMIASKSSGG